MLFVRVDVQYVVTHDRVAHLLIEVIALMMSKYSWVVCNGHFVIFSNIRVYTADIIVNKSSRQVFSVTSSSKVTKHQP